MVKDDAMLAQKIVSRSVFNFGSQEMFHNTSAVYKKSNERIQDYQDYFINKNKVLSVIGSGDQILNMILEGVKEIDSFDISVFPKYFLYLKFAAIQGLSREEYIDFFYDYNNRAEVYDDMYDRISEYLEPKVKEFWDALLGFFDWQEVYDSTLFSSEPCMVNDAILQNKFLQSDEDYLKLRSRLPYKKINTLECDIMTGATKFSGPYDLIYLSNIIYYNSVSDYKKMLGDLRLTDNGLVLTYVYRIHKKLIDFFDSEEYEFKKFVNTDAGIMIYHK